jgi:hypothetical protein
MIRLLVSNETQLSSSTYILTVHENVLGPTLTLSSVYWARLTSGAFSGRRLYRPQRTQYQSFSLGHKPSCNGTGFSIRVHFNDQSLDW